MYFCFSDTVLFWNDAQGRKYPFILNNYRGASFKNIYFAGTLAHSLDYRKSAGGFIHGFRYTSMIFSVTFGKCEKMCSILNLNLQLFTI